MKNKNQFAVELGKLSAKSRLKGLSKKERAKKMKEVWQRSVEVRKERSLDKNDINTGNV